MPNHWTEKLAEASDKPASPVSVMLLFLACAVVFALLLAYGGGWERLEKALGPWHWPW